MIRTISPSRMYVIETGDDIFVGRISVVGNVVFIYNGYTGRPPVVALEDIDELTLVEQHPDIDVIRYDDEMIDEMEERLSALEESLDSINTIMEMQEETFALLR